MDDYLIQEQAKYAALLMALETNESLFLKQFQRVSFFFSQKLKKNVECKNKMRFQFISPFIYLTWDKTAHIVSLDISGMEG